MYHQTRWTSEKIRARLDLITPLTHRDRLPLPPFRYRRLDSPTADVQALVQPECDDQTWPRIAPYDSWGEAKSDFLLRTRFTFPAGWGDDHRLALYLPLGESGDFSHPEALIYLDGRPLASCDRHHQEVWLAPDVLTAGEHTLALHGWTGLGGDSDPTPRPPLWMRPCALVAIDEPTQNFVALARIALDTAVSLPENDPARPMLLNTLNSAFKTLATEYPLPSPAFYDSVPAAHAILQENLQGVPLPVSIHAAGHAHIDVAWLWTLGQTRRKAERTFANVLTLMRDFPNFRFAQSQPQLYQFIQQDQPELFAQIKQAVAEGRWEPLGGMWVEADCNLSGGESLARQFLLGRRYFREQFGAGSDTAVLWLPDVFGYAWNLPQLIKQAGLDYFFTIKIGWSQYNRMPYDTFWWQGLDGTRVLTHYSPTPDENKQFGSTYNARATADNALETWRRFQQKEHSQNLLMAYGYGDGGGGPTRAMLENITHMQDFPALPQVRFSSVRDFFTALAAEVEDDPTLPVWKGELYLELHRGTYTTHARNKRANRRAEFALHDVEFLLVLAQVFAGADTAVHGDALRRAWELLCLNQFHDIIPGSSIGAVYAESLAQYAELERLTTAVQTAALATLGQQIGQPFVVNPTSFTRQELLHWPQTFPVPPAHLPQQTAVTAGGGLWLDVGVLAPYSIARLSDCVAEKTRALSASRSHLENGFLRVEVDQAGDIVRLYDKINQRDILPPGTVANQFQAFEDRPLNWEAWDIEIYYDDKQFTADPATRITLLENGRLRVTLEIRRRIRHSNYVQTISLAHNSPRLDFHTRIDWQERHTLLKVAFPVDLLTPTASYEVQWGHVQRPTHQNTSWDWARFESCAHKWVDVSEDDYGVSLLNDSKYGHDIFDDAPHGTVMRLSLLRSTMRPDPEADKGAHEFAYSLFPHAGSLGIATIAQAYALNDALLASTPEQTSAEKRSFSQPTALLSTSAPHVVTETIKPAEDGQGIIARLYVAMRRRGEVRVSCALPLAGAWVTNLLEEDEAELEIVHGRDLLLQTRPFQIITLRLLPA